MSRSEKVSPENRRLVAERSQFRCFWCGGVGAQWHHRRSRRVRLPHRHCACNGVWLCPTCHAYTHAQPTDSLTVGTIVSQWMDEPFLVPIWNTRGWWQFLCDGSYVALTVEQIEPFWGDTYVVRTDPATGRAATFGVQ